MTFFSQTRRSAKLPCNQRWLPWSYWKCQKCAHWVPLNCKFVEFWFTSQYWKKLSTQNVVYMSKERNRSLLFLPHFLIICFCFFFVFLLNFFDIVSSVTTAPDKFQFESQIHLSQVNLVPPIRLKIIPYANFIKWGIRINFTFMGRQYIVNYWDIPFWVSRDCRKMLVPRIVRHYHWEMFLKIPFRDGLVCFKDFVVKTLLAVPSWYHDPTVWQRLSLHSLCSCLQFFLRLGISIFSGTANSNKSAPTRFVAGTTSVRKNGIAVLPITYASAPNHRPGCRSIPFYLGISTCLDATIL